MPRQILENKCVYLPRPGISWFHGVWLNQKYLKMRVTILMFKKIHKIYCYIKRKAIMNWRLVPRSDMEAWPMQVLGTADGFLPADLQNGLTTESPGHLRKVHAPVQPWDTWPSHPCVSKGPAMDRWPVTGHQAASSQGHLHEREEWTWLSSGVTPG